MSYKKHWRIVLAVLLVGLLAFGTTVVGLGANDRVGPINSPSDIDTGPGANEPSPTQIENYLKSYYDDPDFELPCDLQMSKYDYGEPGQLVGGNGGIFEDGAFKVNVEFSDYTGGEGEDANYLSVKFFNANKTIYAFAIKYGGGTDTYYYPSGTTADGPLTVPGQQAISHITFYWCEPKVTGCLEVNKEFFFDDAVGYNFDVDEITVRIVGPSYPAPGSTFTIDIDEDGVGSRTWCDLIPGLYVVTEEGLGAEWEVVVDPETGANVAANQTAVVDIENTYFPPDDPKLTIAKEFEDRAGDAGKNFTVNISGGKFGDDGQDFTFSVNNPRVLGPADNLEFDVEYTITEKINTDYDFVGFKVNDGALNNNNSITIELNQEDNKITVTVVNKLEEEKTGAMRIQKSIQNALADDQAVDFTARLVGPDIDEDVTFSGNSPFMIDGLKMGTYTVSEINVPGGFTRVSPEVETVTITEDNIDTIQVVTITNRRRDDPPPNGNGVRGSLQIQKVVQNGQAGDNDRMFEARLEGPAGFTSRVVKFSANDSYRHFDLPFGEYTITEINIPEGYTLVSGSPQTVTLADREGERSAVVTITNRYEPEPVPEPEPPIVIIEEPPVPPAVEPPVVEEPEPEIVEEPEVIIEVPVEPELPRTGGMTTLMSGLGALMAGAGALLLQRKRKIK